MGAQQPVQDTEPAPVDVVRVVELDQSPFRQDVHTVQVTLTDEAWRVVISTIGRAMTLGRLQPSLLFSAGRNGLDGIHQAQAIAARVEPPAWHIDPEVAEALALRLSEAAEEPAECARCGGMVDIDGAYCSRCER